MDILNYISWVKENKLVTTISDLDTTLIPLGLKDSRRDDNYLSVGISIASLAAIIGGGTGTGTVTSVGATAGTGISIAGTNPITTSGSFTITNTAPDQIVTLTSGTGISTTGAYPNFTITNTQPSSGGTVTSVGLTMPSAFNVANSPITGSATFNVTAAGVPSQYVRGDGVLASFPDISGGGGGQVYYLNGSVSQGTIGGNIFEQLSTAAITTPPGVDFTSGTIDNVAFANFITDVGKPTQEVIPSGVWIFQCYFTSTSNTTEVYATVEVYDGSTFTVISTSLNEIITDGSNLHLYTFTCAVPEYNPLIPVDRIAIRFYPTNLGGNTITLHTEDSHLGSIQTTFTTGVASIDGLTAAAQYLSVGTTGTDFNIGTSGVDTHVFNLPTASGTVRGALSSSNWTTFNNKQNALIGAGLVFSAGGIISYDSTIYTPESRTLTINGLTLNLSGNRTWSVGTVTSVSALTLGTTGTDLSSTIATGTTTPVITLNVPTASALNRGALSSTDWSTFNGKIGGSGTLSYVPRFTGTTTIGNGVIQDNGTNVGVNVAPNTPYKFRVNTSTAAQYAIYGEGLGQGFSGVAGITNGVGVFQNVGVYGSSTGSTTLNVGVQGEIDNALSVNIGGQFSAASGSANYSLQLQDGTETVGRFLKCITSDGKANWSVLPTNGIGFSPMPISVCDTAPTAATTQYYYQTISEVTGTISKVKLWGFSGTDLVLFGIYRGVLGGSMTLIGQGSATCSLGANEITLVAEVGQNLNLTVGENLVVGYYADGTSWRTIYDVGISDAAFGIINTANILTMPSTPTGTATAIRFACTLYS